MDGALERGRESFARKAWGAAFAELSAADADGPLGPEDLELLATSAALIAKDDETEHYATRAHHEFLRRGDRPGAARAAFWLGMQLFNQGEPARAGGWLARAARVLDEADEECVERGYLLVPMALQAADSGDHRAAYGIFEQAGSIAERFGDPDLLTLSRLGRGDALVRLGETADGVPWLDEAMVAVTTEETSPLVTGIVYCAVIDTCLYMFDLRRAQEWTAALTRWTDTQPDLVPFRGQCLVHRARLFELHGSWTEAVGEAQRACDVASLPVNYLVAGSAFYQLAELYRLLGELDRAEDAYRQAGERGRSPQPGLALLRLAQGQPDAAAAAVRRELDEAQGMVARAALLPAYVEVMLSVGDADAARAGSEELSAIAGELDAPYLHGVAGQAAGALLRVTGDPRGALAPLRRAMKVWGELDAPYLTARTRVEIGLACQALGDDDSARLELEASVRTFQGLGAKGDAETAATAMPGAIRSTARQGPLTAREVEVLRLVATGKSNRAVAAELVISEKTVARHVSNIFTKLGLSSRSAATAYAYQHGLVESRT
ncbi:MAG: LuxR C-terminal-related transcriptional regulator [Actinomycetota bacterium]